MTLNVPTGQANGVNGANALLHVAAERQAESDTVLLEMIQTVMATRLRLKFAETMTALPLVNGPDGEHVRSAVVETDPNNDDDSAVLDKQLIVTARPLRVKSAATKNVQFTLNGLSGLNVPEHVAEMDSDFVNETVQLDEQLIADKRDKQEKESYAEKRTVQHGICGLSGMHAQLLAALDRLIVIEIAQLE